MAVGFVAGLLVSVFSRTLVLLAGIGLVLIQVMRLSLFGMFCKFMITRLTI